MDRTIIPYIILFLGLMYLTIGGLLTICRGFEDTATGYFFVMGLVITIISVAIICIIETERSVK